jgi:hypothetical protein
MKMHMKQEKRCILPTYSPYSRIRTIKGKDEVGRQTEIPETVKLFGIMALL